MITQEEFDKFKKEQNEKWDAVLKTLDKSIKLQASTIELLTKLTK